MFDILLLRENRATTKGHPVSKSLTAHTPRPEKKPPSLQARSMTWLWTLALLFVLAGCGNTPSTSSTPSANSTPLNLPPQKVTATPTASASTGDDWTTYHHDNSRAGYEAGAPDPQRLTQAWKVHLDGAV